MDINALINSPTDVAIAFVVALILVPLALTIYVGWGVLKSWQFAICHTLPALAGLMVAVVWERYDPKAFTMPLYTALVLVLFAGALTATLLYVFMEFAPYTSARGNYFSQDRVLVRVDRVMPILTTFSFLFIVLFLVGIIFSFIG